jgi:AraC-like DNA-binding protein
VPVEALDFDTAALPPEQRFPVWASAMPFYQVEAEDLGAFVARVRSWIAPPVVIIDAEVSAVRSVRSLEQIRRDGNDDIIIRLMVNTIQVGEAADRCWIAHPGQIACHDRGHPLDATMTDGRSITLSFPRAYLDEKLCGVELHGTVLGGGIARLLGATMSALPDMLANSAPNSAELARLLRDLVAAALRDSGGADRRTAGVEALRSRVRRRIASSPVRPPDVESLCVELGVSRSALYRAFAAEGGIAKYIRGQRLSRLYRLLCDPLERRTIDELALAHGFSDNAHFSRLFRRTFGESASSLRRRAAARPAVRQAGPGGPLGVPGIFNDWETRRMPVSVPDREGGTHGQA